VRRNSLEEERRKTTLKVTRSNDQRAFLLWISDSTGSDLEDKLLQDVLLYSLYD
jgi:hypothetical protein